MVDSETRVCQNCKTSFLIDASDFAFYEKIKVPPPTWCPECRMVRRLMFRNERSLYKRTCDLCQKEIIAIYPVDTVLPVYCPECWWSDRWDPTTFGRPYDFSKPFFVQFAELSHEVPRPAFYHRKSENVTYAQIVGSSKNVYLSYSIVESEDILYSKNIDKSLHLVDCLNTSYSELCYENLFGEKNYNSHYCLFSHSCMDSWFLYNCINCRNCILSTNLRNKEYMIRNRQLSKEEYLTEKERLGLTNHAELEKLKKEFDEFRREALHKYAHVLKSVNATGDNLLNVKNVQHTFDSYDLENAKYSLRFFRSRDGMDTTATYNGELIYEHANGGVDNYLEKFSTNSISNLNNVDYTDYCHVSSNLFGCISIRNKEYCILNQQYPKEEYDSLRQRIIRQMDEMPYTDSKDRIYCYGEFFPPELSPFAYNETVAHEHFPFTREQAEERGYRWQELEARHYTITKRPHELPDRISEIPDSILQEIVGCNHEGKCNEQCTTAFRVIPQELEFYRKMNLPLPRLCPNCRHYQRIKQRNPLKLWHRRCTCLSAEALAKADAYQNTTTHFHGPSPCPNEFETSYAPDRPEIIYCEQCYQAEVV